jgi:exosortase
MHATYPSFAAAPRLDYASPPRRPSSTPPWLSMRRLRTDRWTVTHLLLAAAMGLLGVLATFDAWKHMFQLARHDLEYSHVFLVPFIAGWLLLVRRLRFRHCKPTGTLLGVSVVAFGWAVHALGFYRGYQTLWHGGAVLVALGCVLSVLGKHALFRFFPAIAVLVFLIPVPPYYRLQLSVPLQAWTAQISQVALEVFGVPIERMGSKLSINGTPVNIVEACNGLRLVIPLILISYAFSFGLPLRNSVRFLVLLASPLIAIFCNVLRILPTVWLYGYHSKSAGDTFHEWSGWPMLPISFVILLAIIMTLRWAMIPVMKYTLAS